MQNGRHRRPKRGAEGALNGAPKAPFPRRAVVREYLIIKQISLQKIDGVIFDINLSHTVRVGLSENKSCILFNVSLLL